MQHAQPNTYKMSPLYFSTFFKINYVTGYITMVYQKMRKGGFKGLNKKAGRAVAALVVVANDGGKNGCFVPVA